MQKENSWKDLDEAGLHIKIKETIILYLVLYRCHTVIETRAILPSGCRYARDLAKPAIKIVERWRR